MFSCFELEFNNHIAHLKLNRPQELNAMNLSFWKELPLALDAISEKPDIRALVISSTGKHFSAGMDLSVFQNNSSLNNKSPRDRERLKRLVIVFQEIFSRIEKLRIPVISAIHGACIGAGLDMVTACDMRYALKSAFFCIQEINIGMMADLGTLQRLPKLMPEAVVRELAYTGERLSAQRAKDLGFVNELFETQEQMMEAVMQTAKKISERSPLAVSASKLAINYGRDHSIADALDFAANMQAAIFDLEEFAESAKARQEERAPDFADLHSSLLTL